MRKTVLRFLNRKIVDPVSAAIAWLLFQGVKRLPIVWASNFGGALARALGPRLPVHRVARDNLRAAFPEKSAAEIETVLTGMWDNLGRTFGEFPHLHELFESDRLEVIGLDNAIALREDGLPGLLWSGHIGNWELISAGPGLAGLVMHRIYRRPNNPWMEWLFGQRGAVVEGELLPKGSRGARRALALLKKGEHLGMLVDQKMNDGIPVPFFGRIAMTAPALVTFALRFDCPVVACRAVRLPGVRFRLEISPPARFAATGDRHADELAGMTEINRILEGWIREHPEQWLWVHRRWPR